MELQDTLVEVKDLNGNILSTTVQRPTNIVNNQLGPYVAGDVVEVLVRKNGAVTNSISYLVKSPIQEGKQLFASARIDFCEVGGY